MLLIHTSTRRQTLAGKQHWEQQESLPNTFLGQKESAFFWTSPGVYFTFQHDSTPYVSRIFLTMTLPGSLHFSPAGPVYGCVRHTIWILSSTFLHPSSLSILLPLLFWRYFMRHHSQQYPSPDDMNLLYALARLRHQIMQHIPGSPG